MSSKSTAFAPGTAVGVYVLSLAAVPSALAAVGYLPDHSSEQVQIRTVGSALSLDGIAFDTRVAEAQERFAASPRVADENIVFERIVKSKREFVARLVRVERPTVLVETPEELERLLEPMDV